MQIGKQVFVILIKIVKTWKKKLFCFIWRFNAIYNLITLFFKFYDDYSYFQDKKG